MKYVVTSYKGTSEPHNSPDGAELTARRIVRGSMRRFEQADIREGDEHGTIVRVVRKDKGLISCTKLPPACISAREGGNHDESGA